MRGAAEKRPLGLRQGHFGTRQCPEQQLSSPNARLPSDWCVPAEAQPALPSALLLSWSPKRPLFFHPESVFFNIFYCWKHYRCLPFPPLYSPPPAWSSPPVAVPMGCASKRVSGLLYLSSCPQRHTEVCQSVPCLLLSSHTDLGSTVTLGGPEGLLAQAAPTCRRPGDRQPSRAGGAGKGTLPRPVLQAGRPLGEDTCTSLQLCRWRSSQQGPRREQRLEHE